MIKFNQNDWLKPHIDTSTYFRKKGKNDFEKDIFKLMNSAEITKKIIEVTTDKLGGQFLIKFVGLIAKIYSCLVDDASEDKKSTSI